jgi:hypothetical protein
VGAGGAKLAPPGRVVPSPEYRDPERERRIMRETGFTRSGEPRHDVFGAGATLFAILDGGPPSCGPTTPFTRPVPPAAAYVAYRAMADGPARYPTARSMIEDVDRLRRLARRGKLDSVGPDELPSYAGRPADPPRRLAPFQVRRRRSRRRAPALLLLLLLAIGAMALATRSDEPTRAATTATARRSGLAGLLAGWRERIDERLRAAGEELDPISVPLLVVADAPVPRDLGWVAHPSARLAAAVREVLREGVESEEVQGALLGESRRDTLPAVLWVTQGPRPGTVRARLYYRGMALDAVSPTR